VTPVEEFGIDVDEEKHSILDPGVKAEAVFEGEGDDSIVCGRCDAMIADGIDKKQLQGMFIRCPGCNSDLYFPEQA
jgi:DNA-directed RNA polymerase subunit RPC12/RpoP